MCVLITTNTEKADTQGKKTNNEKKQNTCQSLINHTPYLSKRQLLCRGKYRLRGGKYRGQDSASHQGHISKHSGFLKLIRFIFFLKIYFCHLCYFYLLIQVKILSFDTKKNNIKHNEPIPEIYIKFFFFRVQVAYPNLW